MYSTFLPRLATLVPMEETFGKRLQAARKTAGYRTQATLGDVLGYSARTIRSWETNEHRPDLADRQRLRKLLGEFDAEGDEVERAVRSSELEPWRQTAVIGVYQRHLAEQSRDRAV